VSIPILALPLLAASASIPADTAIAPPPTVIAAPAQVATAAPVEPIPPVAPATPPAAPTATTAPTATNGPATNGQAGGDIVVTARVPSKADPVEVLNAQSFEVVQAVDRAVIAPVTHGYMRVVPKPAQKGLHNFLNNLDEPIVFANFLLQLKLGKAAETFARFFINSTVGIAGLIDVAKKKPYNLPRRSNGLADTLGYYGVGPGPYFFLPVIGPTTLRDMLARPFDLAILPTAVGKPFTNPAVSLGKGTLSALDERANTDESHRKLHQESADPYVAVREDYLARRRAEIDVLRGRRKSVDSPAPTTAPAPAPVAAPAAEPAPPAAPEQAPAP